MRDTSWSCDGDLAQEDKTFDVVDEIGHSDLKGADIDRYFREGRIREIAEYCESDVVNTYRVWLRHELFQGRLSDLAFETSESKLEEFIKARSSTKSHLTDAIDSPATGSS